MRSRDEKGKFKPSAAVEIDPSAEVSQIHKLGRFGSGYGCLHCGCIFMGCRTAGEAQGRLVMHRAAVLEGQERIRNGESNLMEEGYGLHG
jgi:hypothetical protein